MKKFLVVLVVVLLSTLTYVVYSQQNIKSEENKHPRITTAIKEMESAIAYMEKAPDDFGGHKAQAIADTKKAVESLKLALQYRAKEDNQKNKKK